MNYDSHPGLRAQLQFEEQKHGIPVQWASYVPDYLLDRRFRPEITVIGLPADIQDTLEVVIDGQRGRLRGRPHAITPGQAVGVTHEGVFTPLATVEGRRIHLLIDLEAAFTEPSAIPAPKLFDVIFSQAMPLAAAFVKGYTWDQEVEQYVSWKLTSLEEQVREWRQAIRDNAYEVDRLTSRIATLVRKNLELNDSIKLGETASKSDRTEKAHAEFHAIRKLMPAVVTDMQLEYGKLRVELAPVTIDYDDRTYEMGTYTVTIYGDTVRISNDSGTRIPHPHVNSEGIPCWGNLGPAMAKLLGQGEHAALIVTIRQFLESFNARDAYLGIEHWDPDHEEENEDEDEE